MTTTILLAMLLTLQPVGPLVDEGDRWESATLIQTHDDDTQLARILFWRRDSFGKIHPAASLEWKTLISYTTGDGFEFFWHDDDYDGKCYRRLRVAELFVEHIDLRKWRVSWPNCPANMEGFLPNPERRAPE